VKTKKKKPFTILSATAILGYGFPEESFLRGVEAKPDLIAVDGGSVDPGPFYLGSGKPFVDRSAVKRDLRYMITAGVKNNVPVVIGTAGGSGARPHVDWCREIISEIALEEKISFTMGVIYADVEKTYVLKHIDAGDVVPLGGLPALDTKTLGETTHIVAQMGTAPIINALEKGCQVVLAGRAYDPSVFAALPIANGYDTALAIHLGKILECAAIAADPGSGAESVLGVLYDDHFELRPLSGDRKFTKESTAAHSLYEKSNPYALPGPGGILNLEKVSFTEIESGCVEVRGSQFIPDAVHRIKLEGARRVGFRTISMAGTRDPIMIRTIDSILSTVKERIDKTITEQNINGSLYFHVYGKNGVMGDLEIKKDIQSHELGILIEGIADTQEHANTICSLARSTLLHYGYPGRIATAGNLAFPFSPSDIPAGAVYEFSIYHLIEADESKLFPVIIEKVGEGK